MGSLRILDLFPKVPTDLSQATVMGGWFSTITGVLMLLLFQVLRAAFHLISSEEIGCVPEWAYEALFLSLTRRDGGIQAYLEEGVPLAKDILHLFPRFDRTNAGL